MADQYIREYVSTLLKYKDGSASNLEHMKSLVTGHDFYKRRDSGDGSVCSYYYGNGHTPLTEDEKVLASYMEGLWQLIRIIDGSVDWFGCRHRNCGVLKDSSFNILVFHTSNANILNSVSGCLYCTSCPCEAIQMWSLSRARKRCYYVNIFKSSIFDDLCWANGDRYECQHGGRLLIDSGALTPIDFVEKSSLGVMECELESKYGVHSLTREFERLCEMLVNPLSFNWCEEITSCNIDTSLTFDSVCKSLIEQGVLSKIIEREE